MPVRTHILVAATTYLLFTLCFYLYVHFIHVGSRPDDIAALFGPIGWLVYPGGFGLTKYLASSLILFGIFLSGLWSRSRHILLALLAYMLMVAFWLVNGFTVAVYGV